jgi:protein-L-isoaspartate(D-aspartate) O-methyltransferase
MAQGYRLTPDADPRHLYQNVLVALDAERRLNNGEPLGLALFLDILDLQPGERFLHVGCGVGYYTAVAAHALGPQGAVTAVEIDPTLAARAQQNLQPYPTVRSVAGDGSQQRHGEFDAIFVNAGCTRLQPAWLDQLALGGRLLVPLTVSLPTMPGIGGGCMLLVTRTDAGYTARFTAPVGIFHCEGARSPEGEKALALALALAFASGNQPSVQSLRRDTHEPGPGCWLHGEGFCLSKRISP